MERKTLVQPAVHAARHNLYRTLQLGKASRPVEQIAEAVGFGSSHALRNHFRRVVELTPRDYRSQFSDLQLQQ